MNAEHLRRFIERLEQELSSATEDEVALMESLQKIDLDLSNTQSEFVHTTGRDPSLFYGWRKRAKWAQYHKRRAVAKKREEILAMKRRMTDAQMLLYATESRYIGEDAESLLTASYHLMMEILQNTTYVLDEHQLGLVAAIRERTMHTTNTLVVS
jgi:hypothetical protein